VVEQFTSPIPSTLDKFHEAFFFLSQTMRSYHAPAEFRYNLNAFIQALRNITFMLQSEENKPEGFAEWYAAKQEEMRNNELLKKFVGARNLIVKQGMLEARSTAHVGIFKGRNFHVGAGGKISPFMDTRFIIEKAKEFYIGYMIDEEHSAIGEQIGVEREWIVDEIGAGEIVSLCYQALDYMSSLVSEAHELFGVKLEPLNIEPDIQKMKVVLESDLNPTLPKKWGWESEDA
jgi:hypothetical protein